MAFVKTLRLCMADFTACVVWVFSTAFLGEAAKHVSNMTGCTELNATLALITGGLVIMAPLCAALGGAGFNPAVAMSFTAAGKESIFVTLPRVLFQALGSVAAGHAAIYVRGAAHLQSLSSGVKPGVHIYEGAACEFILSFISCLIIIYSIGLKTKLETMAVQLGATILLILGGLEWTGPSMNPAVTFCWFWHFEGHDIYEHLLVFWLAPVLGSVLAGRLCIEAKQTKSKGRKKAKAS